MEAALRTAADVLSGQNLENVEYSAVRGLSGIKESTVKLGPNSEIELNIAVSHQMRNVRDFLEQIELGKKTYHFIEISKYIFFLTTDYKGTSLAFVHSLTICFFFFHSDMSRWLHWRRWNAPEP